MISTKYDFANAVITDDDQALQQIHLQAKNIAIYQRDIAPLTQELQQLTGQNIECRASGTIAEISAAVEEYFNQNLTNYPSLSKDVAKLLQLFEETTKASSFRLLLATVRTNMCRKFHTDINDLRLLCTYVGPGTLWLPDEAINQKAVQAGAENEDIVKDEQLIQQVDTGDIVFLKGALYPEAAPILHRSPTIEENGEERLLLRIDTNEFLNFLR